MNELDHTKIPAPVTIAQADVSTHLAYMRRDIDQGNINAKQGLEEIAKRIDKLDFKLDGMNNNYVTRIDFDEHIKVDDDHEKRIRELETISQDLANIKKIVYGAVSLILMIVFSAIIYLAITKH